MNFELPKDYINNNPNILKKIVFDMKKGNNFGYLFSGVVGCGKTYLAEIIMKHLYGYIISANDLCMEYKQLLRRAYSNKHANTYRKYTLFGSKFFLLDDVGSEAIKDEDHKIISDTIEQRYLRFKSDKISGTIITTNLKTEDLRLLYGDRIVDRIAEMCTVMTFNNHSFRTDKTEVIKG